MEVLDIVHEAVIKIIPKKKKCKKAKRLSEEVLQTAMKRREAKGKGEKERYTHMNAEFQTIARGDKKAFLSDQCKEIEENNRMEKTRDLFKKIRDTMGTFHAEMGTIKDRDGMNLTEAEDIRRGGKNTQKNYTKKIFTSPPRGQTCISHSFCTAGRLLTAEPPGETLWVQQALHSIFPSPDPPQHSPTSHPHCTGGPESTPRTQACFPTLPEAPRGRWYYLVPREGR